jgi:hypothetical protein
MAIRIGIFALPTAAVVGLVLLLNGLNAGAGIAAAALGVVAVVSGAELPRARRAHQLVPHHIDR